MKLKIEQVSDINETVKFIKESKIKEITISKEVKGESLKNLLKGLS